MASVDYANLIQKYLGEHNIEAAFTTVNEQPDALNNASEIISVINAYINANTKVINPDVFNVCIQIYELIAQKCCPEDVLLGLLVLIQKPEDHIKFVSLLKTLAIALLRCPSKRVTTSFKWGFSSIKTYLDELKIPEEVNNSVEEDQNLLLCDISHIELVYDCIIKFYKFLISKTLLNDDFVYHHATLKSIYVKSLVQLLGRPLTFINLSNTTWGDTSIRIVKQTLRCNTNVFSFDELHLYEDIEKINDLSIATLYYLVLVENICIHDIPKVYNLVYIFQTSLKYVTELCRQEWRFAIERGLHLLQFILHSVSGVTLSYRLLEDKSHCKFCKTILNVIVYNSHQGIRAKATQLLHQYLFSFDDRGGYLLIYNLTKTLDHVQSVAYIIQQYKDMIFQHFQSQTPLSCENVSKYFSSRHLFTLLDLFCKLKDDKESDVLESSSIIISSLNLLRFVLKYDAHNVTQIWDYVPKAQSKYLVPLADCVIVSKRYCNEKIKEVTGNYIVAKNIDFTVTVAGQTLSQLEATEQLSIYQNALNTLDLIEALLSWVNEIITFRV